MKRPTGTWKIGNVLELFIVLIMSNTSLIYFVKCQLFGIEVVA